MNIAKNAFLDLSAFSYRFSPTSTSKWFRLGQPIRASENPYQITSRFDSFLHLLDFFLEVPRLIRSSANLLSADFNVSRPSSMSLGLSLYPTRAMHVIQPKGFLKSCDDES
jgi:hypothetical protein